MSRSTGTLLLVALSTAGCATVVPHEIAGAGFYQDVSWSPDSKWVAYSVQRNKEWGVYVARPDGSNEKRISAAGISATWTSWSPDGGQLAFAAGSQGRTDIVIASLRRSEGERHLTTDGESNSAPSWSPNGKLFVFTSRRTGKSHLYVVRSDGSDLHQLTFGDSNESNPQWSRDGTRIVFYSDVRGKLDVVCTVTVDGNDLKLLTPPDMHAIYPGWAPKGEIIFASANEGQPRTIMLLGKDGQIRSTSHSGFFASVAPNGRLIAVIDGRYPESRIRVEQYSSAER